MTDTWNGVDRVRIASLHEGALGTILFDLKCIWHASKSKGLCLTLGYNTAIFWSLLRLLKISNVANMDGLEWKRAKWGALAKAWLWFNERVGCWLGNRLIADHPEIERHLVTRVRESKVAMIPYGAEEVDSADSAVLNDYELFPLGFSVVIARPEPENSILEIVEGFSSCHRGHKLIVLGNFNNDNDYHRLVIGAASAEVVFLGAIYDARIISALRFFSKFYIHGHQVGGTNPSLVEALGAGCAVIAHDNVFNRWVAGESAFYFADANTLSTLMGKVIDPMYSVEEAKRASRKAFHERFTWDHVLQDYENVLSSYSN